MLCERKENRPDEYEPYLTLIKESDSARDSMFVASAMLNLGRFDEADYYAYKAIYYLNGADNIEVFESLFLFNYWTLSRRMRKTIGKTITSNMIVSLLSEGEQWIVALDSEEGFGEKTNHSLGVEHIGRTDPIYVKLIGKRVGQVLTLRGKKYKIVSFEPREYFMSKYVNSKLSEHRDELKGAIEFITTGNTTEMIEQMVKTSDNREHINALLDAYNFGINDLGIPVDSFIDGEYERYIDAQNYLLYTKDLAYYSGEPQFELHSNETYVPTLSTLVLLASKGWLNTLDWLNNRIVIPESYMNFFKEQYSLAVRTQDVSAGKFVPLDNGKFTIIKPDKRLPEIWEAIINKCNTFSVVTVTDDERIKYKIIGDYSYERLFSKIKINVIQLDALILAERIGGVYYCDDLFFRKIANAKRIKNINFATVLYAQQNLNVVMPIIMELSQTNYIYTPFRFRNIQEHDCLIKNLLEGEKKKICYSQLINSYDCLLGLT